MLGASIEFILFSLCVAILFQVIHTALLRKCIIVLAACWMLSTLTHDLKAFIPLAVFLPLGYMGFRAVKRSPKTLPLWVGLIVLLFMYLKKYTIVPAGLFIPFPYATVGLSYILFRILHTIVDAGTDSLDRDISFFDYLVYNLNFTTLVSGPIARYPDFSDSLDTALRTRPTIFEVGAATERIITGFFKTSVLGMIFTQLQSMAMAQVAAVTGVKMLSGITLFASYPFFLYCNFSGYIDIVIGIGQLMGLKLPENFNRPFSADSFIEFWNRWHITLSSFLRDYVYNPFLMALMRRFPSPTLEASWGVLAFFVTFFLVGAWHGQTAGFIFFGFLQGLGVSVNKLYQIVMTKRLGRKQFRALSARFLYVVFARGLTFTWFAFTLLWFHWNFAEIRQQFEAVGWRQAALVWIAIWLTASVGLAVWEWLRSALLGIQAQGEPVLYSRYLRTAWATGLILVAAAVVLLSNQPAPDLVYKAF